MEPITVIVWTFVLVFVATSVITIFGIVENFRLIEVKEIYLRGLYTALLLEVVVAGVAIASGKLDPLIQKNKADKFDVSQIRDVEGPESVGAMITNCVNGKPSMLFVLHNEEGRLVYSPPAGGVNPSDGDAFTAAIRETKEETGYRIRCNKKLGNSPKGNLNFRLVNGIIDSSYSPDPFFHETVGLIWCNPKDIPIESWRFPEQREWIIELYEQEAPTRCN